jgi:phenylalanyl-tRNA synthetase beta chain
MGSVYLPKAGQKLPDEPRRLAIVLCGKRYQDYWGDTGALPDRRLDFYDLKGVIEGLLSDLHVSNVRYIVGDAAMLHPGKSARIMAGEHSLGFAGELHPKVAEAFDLAGKTVLVGDISLACLQAAMPRRYAYKPVSRFPIAKRDIAVIVEESLSTERVEGEIRAAGGELLHEARLFDLYRGDSIPTGTKSLAFALVYQASDRTLAEKEVEKAHKTVENRLRHVLKAQIRGQDA